MQYETLSQNRITDETTERSLAEKLERREGATAHE